MIHLVHAGKYEEKAWSHSSSSFSSPQTENDSSFILLNLHEKIGPCYTKVIFDEGQSYYLHHTNTNAQGEGKST